ncbi:hypothetical protein B0J18DRAFT_275982 [Chaetomium sp. MPI-SDFR-AT-0129]|nr:hypothetical protein B0J18DRAFT_275982 [Chaetomium sp. MPI-SDFR-AT-0129]
MFTTKAHHYLLLLLTTHTTLASQTNHPDPTDPDPDIFQPHYDPSPLADLTFNHTSLPEPFTNPSLDSLSALDILLNRRQQQKCPDPGGPICSATQCCRTGQQCCPRGCCSLEENCYPAGKGCCPKNAQTCGGSMCVQPGSVCCGTAFACKPGRVCNVQAGGCCPTDWRLCPTTCCPPGSTCARQSGYCSRLSWSTTQRTSTIRSTSTRVSTYLSTATSSRKLTSIVTSVSQITSRSTEISTIKSTRTSIRTSTSTSTSTDACKATSNANSRELQGRQAPDHPKITSCVRVCHSSGQNLPVVEFHNIPGQTDQLFRSMCEGMNGWLRRQQSGIEGPGPIHTDLDLGEDIFTYGGPTMNNPEKVQRRKEVKCRKFCKTMFPGSVGLECDEYPPAMFTEGGGLATKVCVPKEQNSKFQGPQLSDLVRECDLKKGEKVLIRLKGGCKQFSFTPRQARRDSEDTDFILDSEETGDSHELSGPVQARDVPEGPNFGDSTSELLDPYQDGSLTYVAIPLGELADGHYELDAKIPGKSVVRAEVVNLYGDSYVAVDNPSSSERLVFDVTDNLTISASLVAYTNEKVELSFSGTISKANEGQVIRSAILPTVVFVTCVALLLGLV